MSKKVLITGVCGQDGTTMVDYLLKNTDVEICGVVHNRKVTAAFPKLWDAPYFSRLSFVEGDITDGPFISRLVSMLRPDYFLNFGGSSSVSKSLERPEETFKVNTLGVLNALEAIRKLRPSCRFFSAGSSEELSDSGRGPKNPYGVSKRAAQAIVQMYREYHNIYAVHGTLFNHESFRRSPEFVTRKITKGLARIVKAIKAGQPFEAISLGNLDAERDWSDAEDIVDGVWRMVNWDTNFRGGGLAMPFQNREAKDYTLASGELHSVRDFLDKACECAGLKVRSVGNSSILLTDKKSEEYIIDDSGATIVRIDPELYRPLETKGLRGDSSAITKELGWQPKISFNKLVEKMVKYDLNTK